MSDDLQGAAEGLHLLLQDAELRGRFCEAVRRKVVEAFSGQSLHRRMIEVYDRVESLIQIVTRARQQFFRKRLNCHFKKCDAVRNHSRPFCHSG